MKIRKDNLGEELLASIFEGEFEKVKKLIHLGADIRYRNGLPFVVASERGHVNIMELLIDQGINPKKESQGALFGAAIKNQPKAVELLIEKGNFVGLDFHLALGEAVDKGFGEMVDILSRHCPDKTSLDNFALPSCVHSNNFEMAEILMKNGADPNYGGGKTIRYAIMMGNANFVRKMLATGKIKKETLEGDVFTDAIDRQDQEIINLLMDAGAELKNIKAETLYKAIFRDDIETVKILLKNMPESSYDINTGLEIAARDNRAEIVQLLLDNGADAGVNNSKALYSAIYNKNLWIIELLVNTDIDIFSDKRILEEARADDHINEILQKWIDKNINEVIDPIINNPKSSYADFNEAINNKGQNVLILAALSGDRGNMEKIFKALIDNQDEIQASDFLRQDQYGFNLLSALDIYGNLDMLDNANLWKDNSVELKKLITNTPDEFKAKIDFDALWSNILRGRIKANKIKKITMGKGKKK